MTSYTPAANKIIHVTSVDFVNRQISKPVELVQYDDTLPILEVHLFSNGVKYPLSSSSVANIRFKNLEGYKVYSPALGYNSSDTSIVYFTITRTMTVSYGRSFAVVELKSGTDVANSANILFVIDKNPIQISDIEASDEITAIVTSVDGQTGAITGVQKTSNLVTTVSSSSTNSQYPSAKLFYDTIGDVETLLSNI